ncbi:MAG: dephospho-CoA kinase [Rikenellaceae bacterium]|jgi:dephospho-CoA kinase|nr:dephospho-CoA kinase [Rikenellaceae bacterium]
MIRVGLTGGIGSGKTTVARVLELLGIPVYYADERGRRLSDDDPEVVPKIKTLFGEEAYVAGQLNRPLIASRVFSDATLLERLNAIIHPAVRRDYRRWAESHNDAPYTLLESAILFESGFDSDVDQTVAVTAPEALRIERVMRRDSSSPEAVRARIAAQTSEAERTRRADYLLRTDDRQLLIPQILTLDQQLRQLSTSFFPASDCS